MLSPSQAGIPDLRGWYLPELEALAEHLGEPRYRGRQMARWLYVRGVASVDEMADRHEISRRVPQPTPRPDDEELLRHVVGVGVNLREVDDPVTPGRVEQDGRRSRFQAAGVRDVAVAISPSYVVRKGTVNGVTVVNPGPGGGTSNTATFTIIPIRARLYLPLIRR